jgi:5-methylcytosine-specific restriction protein A
MQFAALKGKTAARGYDGEWQALRLRVLRLEPFCRFCLAAGRHTAAEHVDHVKPLSAGGTNAIDNLRPLCATCHNRRTRADQVGRRTP